ncbi:MAG: M28 family peptidase [Cyclobacteriaceae bacterium]|nr:M28 family peptidase [Cyclobacteriaceae bacterium]
MKKYIVYIVIGLHLISCSDAKKERAVVVKEEKPLLQAPSFNADSAYAFIKKQVDFGPRVPNSAEHVAAGDYFVEKFKAYGAEVKEQNFEATTFDGVNLSLRNIISSFNPQATKRILLATHWDSRPFADKDEHAPNEAMEAANDGASGVGVLLEIGRQLSIKMPHVGVDIILFDGEDWGEKYNMRGVPTPEGLSSWWCLGSQYWSKNKNGYGAYYGILLDMVGARGAQFHIEGLSNRYAPKVVKKIWNTASDIGYSNYFIPEKQSEITDDHQFVNEVAKIPMVDIVHYDPNHGYFGDYHHTHKDNLSLIDKRTLKAVGQTVLTVIFNE